MYRVKTFSPVKTCIAFFMIVVLVLSGTYFSFAFGASNENSNDGNGSTTPTRDGNADFQPVFVLNKLDAAGEQIIANAEGFIQAVDAMPEALTEDTASAAKTAADNVSKAYDKLGAYKDSEATKDMVADDVQASFNAAKSSVDVIKSTTTAVANLPLVNVETPAVSVPVDATDEERAAAEAEAKAKADAAKAERADKIAAQAGEYASARSSLKQFAGVLQAAIQNKTLVTIPADSYIVNYYLNSVDEENLLGTDSGEYEEGARYCFNREEYLPDSYSSYILNGNGNLSFGEKYQSGQNTFTVVYLPGSHFEAGDFYISYSWLITLDYNGCEVEITEEGPGGGSTYIETSTKRSLYVSNDLAPQSLTSPVEPPAYEGHTFVGWFDDPTTGNEVDLETATFSSNTTLYAHWVEDETTDPSTGGNEAGSNITIETEASTINVTVPTNAAIVFKADGSNVYPSNYTIKNNNALTAVFLNSIDYEGVNGWSLTTEDDTFQADQKKFSLRMGERNTALSLVDKDNGVIFNNGIRIAPNGTKVLDFFTKRGVFSSPVTTENAMQMTMHFSWELAE